MLRMAVVVMMSLATLSYSEQALALSGVDPCYKKCYMDVKITVTACRAE